MENGGHGVASTKLFKEINTEVAQRLVGVTLNKSLSELDSLIPKSVFN